MKTLTYTYELVPGGSSSERFRFLSAAKSEFKQRGLAPQEIDGNEIEVISIHKDWTKAFMEMGHSSNSGALWRQPVEGMRLKRIRVVYDRALMPIRSLDVIGNYGWRDGESVLEAKCWPKGRMVVVACFPKQKTVSMAMGIGFEDELDLYRRAWLEIQGDVENTIILTNISLRLIKALGSKRKNPGRIKRFKNELFLAIARMPFG